jgi:hypothetical protein
MLLKRNLTPGAVAVRGRVVVVVVVDVDGVNDASVVVVAPTANAAILTVQMQHQRTPATLKLLSVASYPSPIQQQ